jgi:phosphoserine phosphatase RsbU/P
MEQGKKYDEHLGRTLRDDLMNGNILRSLRLDFDELREFYIDEERKERLQRLGWFKRTFLQVWWYIKILLLRLSPARRLLLLIGMLLILLSGRLQLFYFPGQSVSVQNQPETYLLGGILIVFVLMLELKDKLLARDELAAGRSVQYALMPPQEPSVPGWSVWLHTEPANDVGGDLVDYISIDPGKHGLVIGDVAGKGLRAALLMAKLQATIRALIPGYRSLDELLSKINSIFFRDSIRSIFASVLYMEVTSGSGNVRLINAGHLPPVHVHDGTVTKIATSDPALGIVPNPEFREVEVSLHPGDYLIAFSDGITEARDRAGRFYDEERVLRVVSAFTDVPPRELGKNILDDVARFRGDAKVYDDLSMVIIRYA